MTTDRRRDEPSVAPATRTFRNIVLECERVAAMEPWRSYDAAQASGARYQGRLAMRRFSILSAIVGIAALSCAPAQAAGYYVIRWENTGICQIWNQDLTQKPWEWPSHYKVVSKTFPTFGTRWLCSSRCARSAAARSDRSRRTLAGSSPRRQPPRRL